MPRKRSPVGIAVGKLILALQKECEEASGDPDAALAARKVMDRAHRLLEAAQMASVSNLLDGRSVAEYLDAVWVETHPSVKPSVEGLVAAVSEHE
jgi:hypothetical protein